MPARFKVRIEPVDENVERVLDVLMEYLGPDTRAEAERLVEEGGVVLGDLNPDAAEQVKEQLERAGAVAEIVPEEETTGEELPDALEGRVRGIESGRPVEGAEVSIRPADPDMDEAFGSAPTAEDGFFTLPRFGVFLRALFPETHPELQVTVVRGGQEVDTRTKPFDWEAFAQGDYTFEIEAAAPPTAEDGRFTVSGQITRSNGESATGVVVRAYDRDMRNRELLGEATAGKTGEYEITYTPDQFRRAEKERADLVMSVVNEAGTELEVDSDRDDTIFNAQHEEVVNLQIISDELIEPSEYEWLVQALNPLLEGVPLADLTDDDIDFLAHDTGQEASRIRFLSQDARLSQEHDVREAVFYGFARREVGIVEREVGPRLDLATLLEQSNDVLRSHLNAAISNSIIPVRLRESLDDIIIRLEALRAEQREREREEWPEYELTGRLLNEETDDPLAGYAVDATDRDARPEHQYLGRDFTGEEGRFTFSYRTPPEESELGRAIELTVLSQDGEELATRVFDVQPDQPEELEWRIELPEPEVPGDGEQVQDLGVEPSDELDSLLEERGLNTLADVRSLGGLTRIEGLEDDESAQLLQAHVDLSILPSDGQARATLIENDYLSPADIASTTRGEFIESVEETIEQPDKIYDSATAANRRANSFLTEYLTNRANGLPTGSIGEQLQEVGLPDSIPDLCVCRDCESAVSPAAYLADLTQYVLDHVKEDGNKITLDRLEALLYQPFGDLPVTCENTKEEVRQVRICIEVLLRHLGESRIQFLHDATSEGGEYRRRAYESLLTHIGTSREELRLAQTGSDEERQSLASRLGIAADHLNKLLFDPSAQLGTPHDTTPLSEEALEVTFGLRAFTYYSNGSLRLADPLRDLDDPKLLHWQVEHLRQQWMEQDHPTDAHRDEKLPKIEPDVIGPDDFRTPDTDKSTAFQIWTTRRGWVDKQLEELRNTDRRVRGNTVPDIRGMFTEVMARDIAYTHIDGSETTETPWRSSAPSPDTFEALLRKLSEGTDAETARKTVQNELHLTAESFTRLVRLWQKDRKWAGDERYPRVTEAEWQEVHSILVQAQKRSIYSAWIAEENSEGITLGPQTFWFSLRKPEEGRWSSALELPRSHSNIPFIDPERVDLDELPEPTAGGEAITLWKKRQKLLQDKRAKLQDTYEQNGFDAVVEDVYGSSPLAGPPDWTWSDYFQNRPIEDIASDLDLEDKEAARKLKSVRAKAIDSSTSSNGLAPPSTEELQEIFVILTTAWKRRDKYAAWFSKEHSENLTTYWKVRKARLPQWRASRGDRREWQQALNRRSQRPIMGPDMVVPGDDLDRPVPGKPAYDLWEAREQAIEKDLKDAASVTSNNQLDDQKKIDELIQKYVGVSAATLTDVAERQEQGESIDGRLDQLTLERGAFNYLIEVHDRIDQNVSIDESTWKDVASIVVNVSKKRRFAEWREEERKEGVTLSPEHFRLADRQDMFARFDEESPKQWRMSLEATREWRDTLEARIEQRDQLEAALQEAVDQAEEETLTVLRDALIEQLEKPSGDALFNEKAEWASERLLIDTEMSTCRETTRVSQATECLQTLLFVLNTGQGAGGIADFDLKIDDNRFEQHWKWLETYPKWKAAMGVYLYPESMLMPKLRTRETPKFRDLVERLRSDWEVSDKVAHTLADEYAEYYHDICTLTFECACHVETYSLEGPHQNETDQSGRWQTQEYLEVPITLYVFARGGKTDRLYWSRYELPSLEEVNASMPGQSLYTEDSQSFWHGVDFKDLGEVVGAVQFHEKLYIFATTHSEEQGELTYKTVDVNTGQWSEPQTIDLPVDQRLKSVAVEERNGIVTVWDDEEGVAYDIFPAERSPHLIALFENGAIYNLKLKSDILDHGNWEIKARGGAGISGSADSAEQDERAGSAEEWTLLRAGAPTPFNYEQLQQICAAVEYEDGYCLIVRDEAGVLWYRLLIPRYDDGHWNRISEGVFKGAISWQPLGESFDSIYVYYGSGKEDRWRTKFRRIVPNRDDLVRKGIGQNRVGTIKEFRKWLQQVVGFMPKESEIKEGLQQDGPMGERYRLADALCRRFSQNPEYEPTVAWKEGLSLLEAFRIFTHDHPRKIRYRTHSILFWYRKKGEELKEEQIFKEPHRFIGSSTGFFTARRNQFISEAEAPYEELVRTRLRQEEQPGHSLSTYSPTRVRPSLDGPFGIKDATEIVNITERRKAVEKAFKDNRGTPQTVFTYVEEAYYFVPVLLARRLSQSGNYDGALDWYRTVYDYSLSGDPKIWHGLTGLGKSTAKFTPTTSWLTDPLNPHAIAERRPNTGTKYAQFTLFSIIQCLLDYADHEFARDTGESLQRARTLYERALDLLETDELKQTRHQCEELTVEVKENLRKAIGEDHDRLGDAVEREIASINDTQKLNGLDAQLRDLDFEELSRDQRIKQVWDTVNEVNAKQTQPAALGESLEAHDRAEQAAYRSLMSNDSVARSSSEGAMEAMSATIGTNGVDRTIYDNILQDISLAFCIPQNPVLKSLRQHAHLNLRKIRTCRNFAGMKRELEPYAAPTGVESAAPSLGGDGTAGAARQRNIQPTDYRYDTLIERAKRLVNLADKIESSMLSAIINRDDEAYKLLQARQDLELAREGVRLQELRVNKAEDRVELSELQREPAQLRVETYRRWLQQGMNSHEKEMLEAYKKVKGQRKAAGRVQAGIQSAQLAASGAEKGAKLGKLAGPEAAAVGAVIGALAGGAAPWLRFHHRAQAINAQIKAQIHSVKASHARRNQRWRLQKKVAQQNVDIAAQRVDLAEDQVDIVEQQREIAEIETEHAQETVEFLQDEQFTNVELFDWMADVLGGVYRYFLQQATSMAKLAERQLAFERQELPQQFIGSGYWRAPLEGQTGISQDNEERQDRRGLAGSARLLRDIYQLDQYEFRTDERKQQVSKTISLAQLAPFELQQFRETGILTFDTYRELFERDHPGHHLRLIKNVSVSVIALTPPTDGIKAELRNSGISRVVTGGPPFRTEVNRRDPEMITLSSPQNDTGVFQLKPEGEMLIPFEKTGVDTSWELRMPKAANAFDYDTIADVLLTINYTALQSETYRRQVIKRLDPEQSGQRVFSFSDEFADPWYDLYNPAQTDDPMTVTFETRRADYPQNLEDLEIDNVLLYYVTEDGIDTGELKTTLKFTPEDGLGVAGGEATPVEQRVSTRRGNGSPWMPMIGKSVEGEWKLSLPNTAKVKRMFDEEKIEDILFVVTYEGRTPQWPS